MPCAGAVHGVSGLLYSARRGLAHSEPEAQARVGAKSLACASGSDCFKVNRAQYNKSCDFATPLADDLIGNSQNGALSPYRPPLSGKRESETHGDSGCSIRTC